MNMYDIIRASDWKNDKVFILDTETTGIKENDEILSLSILNLEGKVIFDHLIKPSKRKTWVKAQEIHGISPKDVKDKKSLIEYEDELKPIFAEGNLIVGYNVEFDMRLLEQSGARFQCDFFDVMNTYSQVYGKWSDWKQERLYEKLVNCAKHYGYEKFEAHGSLEDTKATLFCFKEICEDKKVLTYWQKELGYLEDETFEERKKRIELKEYEAEKKQTQEALKRKKKEEEDAKFGCIFGIAVIVCLLFLIIKGCAGF